ncbi:MAG: hypothetical protein IJN88_00915 [Clostridia bacterium]|nr:hypothetical protein [Clostridia bacterium]
MKKRIRTVLNVFLVLAIIILTVITGGYIKIRVMESKLHPVTEPFSSMEVVPMCVDYIFPLSDISKSIGWSDYTFIGTVEEIIGTEYSELEYIWNGNWIGLYDTDPVTHYRIKVKHNIKGTAPEEFTMLCWGGQQPGGMLSDMNRTMPEKDTTYVFMCRDSGEGDGRIYYHYSIYLGDKNWYESAGNVSEVIGRYEEYYKNQDLSVRID